MSNIERCFVHMVKERKNHPGLLVQRGFSLAVLTHGHSGYVGIIVLIFNVQSNLDNVIRYYLQFLEKHMYMVFFNRKGAFRAKKMLFGATRSVL